MTPKPSVFTRYCPAGIASNLVSKVRVIDPTTEKITAGDLNALWDTGAMKSCITQKVVATLCLSSVGRQLCRGVKGPAYNSPVYLVSFLLHNGVRINNVEPSLMDEGGTDILIGMDIISAGDFAVTNAGGKTQFSFRVPSMGHIDFQQNPYFGVQSPGQNNPCYCGSDKKFKSCHGKKRW